MPSLRDENLFTRLAPIVRQTWARCHKPSRLFYCERSNERDGAASPTERIDVFREPPPLGCANAGQPLGDRPASVPQDTLRANTTSAKISSACCCSTPGFTHHHPLRIPRPNSKCQGRLWRRFSRQMAAKMSGIPAPTLGFPLESESMSLKVNGWC